jgi:hypothetical protein
VPAPINDGLALKTLTVSTVPSLERHPVPVVVKMTLAAYDRRKKKQHH